MSEKLLIRKDHQKETDLLSEVDTTVNAVNEILLPELEKIGLELTKETLQDCFNGGTDISKQYNERLKKDLAKIGTPVTRQRIQNEAEIALNSFIEKLSPIVRESRKVKQYITVIKGKAVFTDDASELLTESCNVYLTDPALIEKYNLHQEIVDKLNQLFGDNCPLYWHMLFPNDKGLIYVAEMDYSQLQTQRKEP